MLQKGMRQRAGRVAVVVGSYLIAGPAIGLAVDAAEAQEPTETQVLVRVLSHDAKLIGTNVGGARVTIRDALTGTVLTTGIHEGSTGDTDLLVRQPHARGSKTFDTPGAAGFLAVLDLSAPTQLQIDVEGPLAFPDQLQRASKTLYVFPGENVLGEGVVLVLNGFTIRVADSEQPEGGRLEVSAEVRMLCGCPIQPGGLWDADRLTVVARLLLHRAPVAETALEFSGQTSVFVGTLEGVAAGEYELEVSALDPERANFGRALRTVTIDSQR